MANQDQHTMQDPTTQYPKATTEWKQQQDEPGLQREMTPVPDAGEKSYKGSGRLTDAKQLLPGPTAELAGRQRLRLHVKVQMSFWPICRKRKQMRRKL